MGPFKMANCVPPEKCVEGCAGRGTTGRMIRLNSVQALRGIAALAVMLCHLFAIEGGQAERAHKLTEFWVAGAHGVDLFFVISGFVIIWVASDAQKSLHGAADFLYARATRIYPLWWLFAGAMAILLLLFTGVPWDAARLDPKGLDGTTHILKSIALWPQPEHPLLGVGWTLVHEMYFYIGFAVMILLVPVKYRLHGIIAWGAAVLAGSLTGLSSSFGRNLLELAFNAMTLQFIFGAAVAYMIKAGWRGYALPCTVIGAVGLIFTFLSLDAEPLKHLSSAFGWESLDPAGPPWRRVFFYGVPAAVLLYGLVALEIEGNLKDRIPPSLVALGDWSYSLYLCHVLTISAAGRITYAVFSPDSAWATALWLISASLASLITAALAYTWFERPLIAFFRKHRKKLTPPPPTEQSPAAAAE